MVVPSQGGKQGTQGITGENRRGSSNRGFASMDPERQRQVANDASKADKVVPPKSGGAGDSNAGKTGSTGSATGKR
jgi:hypothetical protein